MGYQTKDGKDEDIFSVDNLQAMVNALLFAPFFTERGSSSGGAQQIFPFVALEFGAGRPVLLMFPPHSSRPTPSFVAV